VSDNGPGVAREDIPRILRPFEQIGRTTTDHAAGAGLGLTLVKAFAELHGGELRIDSALGEGFTATLDLPAA
jgi:signal transduction histidine kinase